MNIETLKELFHECAKSMDLNIDAQAIEVQDILWQFFQATLTQAVNNSKHILIEKDKVHTWYQDYNEPESFCDEGDLDCLGDCLDSDDVMQVIKYETVTVSETTMWGVWKIMGRNGYEIDKKEFVLVSTKEEAQSIVHKNMELIGIESLT